MEWQSNVFIGLQKYTTWIGLAEIAYSKVKQFYEFNLGKFRLQGI
jgi:hypothetical protein